MEHLAMMNKRILIALLLLLNISWVHAQGLRQSVCIVRPEYTADDSIAMANCARQLARLNKLTEARTLTSYASGTFGSGVLVQAGTVLTNRHVVGFARYVSIEFVLHDSIIRLTHCPVDALSNTSDLAAIALTEDLPTELVPLSVSNGVVQDGEDITAAGFPGLQGNASWQLTRGTVSNSHLRLETDNNYYVQHTAPIDPGSSGGPLLRKVNDGYEVIGINTLKAFGRDRVGLAIPASDIASFVGSESDASAPISDIRAALSTSYHELLQDSVKLQTRLSKPGIYEPDSHHLLMVDYSTLLPADQSIGLSYDMIGSYWRVGGGIKSMFFRSNAEGQMYEPALQADVHLGGQVTVRVSESQYILPYLTGGVALNYSINDRESFSSIPCRIGVDYINEHAKKGWIVGVSYCFEPMLDCPIGNIYRFGKTVLKHCINLRIGLAL